MVLKLTKLNQKVLEFKNLNKAKRGLQNVINVAEKKGLILALESLKRRKLPNDRNLCPPHKGPFIKDVTSKLARIDPPYHLMHFLFHRIF